MLYASKGIKLMAEIKSELVLSIADKQYNNLMETGKSIKHFFVYFFALLLIVSAITFEPEIFVSAEDNLKEGINQEQKLTLLGLSIAIDSIVKYSSLALSLIYLMLTTFLVYSNYLYEKLIKTYCTIDPSIEENKKVLNYPSMHHIITTLSNDHNSSGIQFVFQILNIVKSFLIYVFPVIIVLALLGEGLNRSDNNYLNIAFYFAPILVFSCMIILTRDWYLLIYNSMIKAKEYFWSKIRSREFPDISIDIDTSKNWIRIIIAIVAAILSIVGSMPLIINLYKDLLE